MSPATSAGPARGLAVELLADRGGGGGITGPVQLVALDRWLAEGGSNLDAERAA